MARSSADDQERAFYLWMICCWMARGQIVLALTTTDKGPQLCLTTDPSGKLPIIGDKEMQIIGWMREDLMKALRNAYWVDDYITMVGEEIPGFRFWRGYPSIDRKERKKRDVMVLEMVNVPRNSIGGLREFSAKYGVHMVSLDPKDTY